MTKEKARKHLAWARESLMFWREKYVDAIRDKNTLLDINGLYLAGSEKTLRKAMIKEARLEIEDAKRRIAKYERIAL